MILSSCNLDKRIPIKKPYFEVQDCGKLNKAPMLVILDTVMGH